MERGNFIRRSAWHRRCFLAMSAATVATTTAAATVTTAAAATATQASSSSSHVDGEGEVDTRRLILVGGMDDRWRRIDAIPLGSTLAHCLRMV
ncbi:MAG: hypothetical protein ABSH17_12360, partial [Syntrophobacteraceae bacterium]